MTEVLIWLFSALFWVAFAALMLVHSIRAHLITLDENGVLRIQRISNVVFFSMKTAGLLAAAIAGGIALVPWLFPGWPPIPHARTLTISGIVLMLNLFGGAGAWLWYTRRRLIRYQEMMERTGRRRQSDPSPYERIEE